MKEEPVSTQVVPAVLAILLFLLAAVGGLIGLIWRMQGKRIDAIADEADDDRKAFGKTATAIFEKVETQTEALLGFQTEAAEKYVTKIDCRQFRVNSYGHKGPHADA